MSVVVYMLIFIFRRGAQRLAISTPSGLWANNPHPIIVTINPRGAPQIVLFVGIWWKTMGKYTRVFLNYCLFLSIKTLQILR